MHYLLEKNSNSQIKCIVCTVWGLWSTRNKLLHENKEIERENRKVHVNIVAYENWRPPDDLNVKINFDAAFERQNNRSCTGIVIRNSSGKNTYQQCSQQKLSHASRRLDLVAESRFLRVEIEGDTLAIIRKLQSEEEDGSEIRAYIVDAKKLCSNFITCDFRHARRQKNKVAHLLEKEGLKENENMHLSSGLSSAVVRAVEINKQGGG
ncbi:cinnamoyl-CoA reductase 1-like [Gossypium australe]|uniref:Cinnamoyl-CoA reductase 1-like n=1 Tax=Gossypium australe TaxID=47621 RepID=A0A5B6V8K6_9ROSI|nr:cinnamoyl-CoA reductase 1-like [Gossypium australe]